MERPYLSIGEVLELLKFEFPDVSISRIRTLEASGHLDLERTASGYRKFYDADVAYLRTLLRGGVGADGDMVAAHASSGGSSAGPGPHSLAADSSADGFVAPSPAVTTVAREPLVAHSFASGESVDATVQPSTRSTHRAGAPVRPVAPVVTRQANDRAVAYDDSSDHPEPLGPDGELPGNPERRHPASVAAQRRANASAYGSSKQPSPTSDAGTAVLAAPTEAPAEPVGLSLVEPAPVHVPVAAAPGEGELNEPTEHSSRDQPLTGSRNPLASNPSGLNMSLDELAKASGIRIEIIRELESLGLVRGQGVFSTVYYDEDALLTCRLVAEFQTYGVEPRHLRMYKLAADREAAFFEQVVTPQLRRKNPDARDKAIETLGDLVRLGEQLRVVALRQVLRSAVDRT